MTSRYDDEHEIRNVLYRYCRGVDRRDFEAVRACYHPDATDDHGTYIGDIDGFIESITKGLKRYEQTMHVIANVLIDVDGDTALSEAYTLAFHRVRPTDSKPARDYTVGLRYVDRFERRGGEWKIAARVCAFSFQRVDSIDPPLPWMANWNIGQPTRDDIVYRL